MEDLLNLENLEMERLWLASLASDWNSLLSSTFAKRDYFFPNYYYLRLKKPSIVAPPTLTSEGLTEEMDYMERSISLFRAADWRIAYAFILLLQIRVQPSYNWPSLREKVQQLSDQLGLFFICGHAVEELEGRFHFSSLQQADGRFFERFCVLQDVVDCEDGSLDEGRTALFAQNVFVVAGGQAYSAQSGSCDW